MCIYDVALLVPPYLTYSYLLPDYLTSYPPAVGCRVAVPLKNRIVPGVVIDIPSSGDDLSLKEIFFPLEIYPLFSESYIRMIMDLSLHLVVEPGLILGNVLPSPLRNMNIHFRKEGERAISLLELQKCGKDRLRELFEEWLSGRVKTSPMERKTDALLSLSSLPPWSLRPNARLQLKVLEHLYVKGSEYRSHLVKRFGPGARGAISSLLRRGLIKEVDSGCEDMPVGEKSLPSDLFSLVPTPHQHRAISRLAPLVGRGEGIALLFGVTGSGKTLVLGHLIKRCLEQGKNCLVLLPEVALASSMYRQLKASFPQEEVFLYHGYLSPSKRAGLFLRACREKGIIVVGTRSSVFLPLRDIGLIIMDEEHDSSFKQEEKLRYHTRDVAYLLSREEKALLLLSSATPDIRTYYSGKSGRYEIVPLPSRVANKSLPEIRVMDINANPLRHGPFCEESYNELKGAISRGEQVIVLLNRRGFAPLIYCISCREVIKCPSCAVSMTYHKRIERLICHYCGRTLKFPMPCPVCGSSHFVPLQQGTEKVEEFVISSFGSSTSIIRLDRDRCKREEEIDALLWSFAKGEYQVLIGTQMCSKGHNFPGVSRVIVVDGDIGLGLPDFRATERTFQLLLQVAGRSGRGEKEGKVYIQTRNPSHYCWQYLLSNDYEGFYRHELEIRKRLRYPPFVRLALVRFIYPLGWERGEETLQEIRDFLKRYASPSVSILGPAPAPVFVVREKRRYHLLIKADDWRPIRFLVRLLLKRFSSLSPFLKLQVDIDPYHLL